MFKGLLHFLPPPKHGSFYRFSILLPTHTTKTLKCSKNISITVFPCFLFSMNFFFFLSPYLVPGNESRRDTNKRRWCESQRNEHIGRPRNGDISEIFTDSWWSSHKQLHTIQSKFIASHQVAQRLQQGKLLQSEIGTTQWKRSAKLATWRQLSNVDQRKQQEAGRGWKGWCQSWHKRGTEKVQRRWVWNVLEATGEFSPKRYSNHIMKFLSLFTKFIFHSN